MKIERTRNAGRNIVFGLFLRLYQILMPFLLRTAMIYWMGVEFLGLDSLFTSILQVLNLAELGVGNAMVYGMYRPIAEDDGAAICALMKLYRIYYRVIGAVIALVGLGVTPLIPMLIKSDLPAGLDVYLLYWLNLAATVCSYWLFAYKNALFQAHQRVDVTSKVSLITYTFRYGAQFLIILFLKNYYLYIMAALAAQILTNIITAAVAERMYPNYHPRGNLEPAQIRQINGRIRDLFTSKLGAVIVNSTDTVVISAFLGLTVLAVYQNYFFILTAVIGFITVLFQASTAGIGNSVIVETKEKNFMDLKKFTFLISWVGGVCTCCLLCLYQPFMKIWVGEELLLHFSAVICFCVYFFVYELNQLFNTYKDAAGIWHQDRFRPLVTSLSNLFLNLILVRFWGIYGVLLSTVLSTLLIGIPWLLHNLFHILFDPRYLSGYLMGLGRYTAVVLLSCVLTFALCRPIQLPDGWTLALRLLICGIVPNLLYWVVYRKQDEFVQCVQMADRLTGGKLKLTRFLQVK